MAASYASEKYLKQVDVLSRRVVNDQRCLTEENQACQVIKELLAENEKEYGQLRSEVLQLQTSIDEQQQREKNFHNTKSLQSALIILQENSAAQETETTYLQEKLKELHHQHRSLCQIYNSKLESIKAQFREELVDDTALEEQLKRDQLICQRSSLTSELERIRENCKISASKDWHNFRETLVKFASINIRCDEEKKKVQSLSLQNQNLECELKNYQDKIIAAERHEQLSEQNKLFQKQQQQPQQENQEYCQPQQSRQFKILEMSSSQVKRKDTPRPKPFISLSFSLPKLQFPSFEDIDLKLSGRSKKNESPKSTSSIDGTNRQNSDASILFSGEVTGVNSSRENLDISSSSCDKVTGTNSDRQNHDLSSLTLREEVTEPAFDSIDKGRSLTYAALNKTFVVKRTEASQLLKRSSNASGISTHSSDTSSFATADTSCSLITSVAAGSDSSNNAGTSGYSSAENVSDAPETVSGVDSGSCSPYFEKIKSRVSSAASKENVAASKNLQETKILSSSSSSLQSKEIKSTNAQDSSSAEVWSTPPSSPACLSTTWISLGGSNVLFPNQEARKAYISSLLKSPELVYGKPPSPVKYTTRPKLSRPLPIPTTDEDSPILLSLPHRPHVEDLTESGETLNAFSSSARKTENTSNVDTSTPNEPQPMEVDAADTEQHEIPFSCSQGFSVSDDLASSGQQLPKEPLVTSYPNMASDVNTVASSVSVEASSNLVSPNNCMRNNLQSGNSFSAGPSASASSVSDYSTNVYSAASQPQSSQHYSTNVYSAVSQPQSSQHLSTNVYSAGSQPQSSQHLSTNVYSAVSQPQSSQHMGMNGPQFFSSPISESGAQVTGKSSKSFLLSSNELSPIYSTSVVADRVQFSGGDTPSGDNKFSSYMFANKPSENVQGGIGALSLFSSPTPGGRSPEEKSSGVNFSLFGEPQPEEERTNSFFSFGFGEGSKSVSEDHGASAGTGFFSLFNSDVQDDSPASDSQPNFRLF